MESGVLLIVFMHFKSYIGPTNVGPDTRGVCANIIPMGGGQFPLEGTISGSGLCREGGGGGGGGGQNPLRQRLIPNKAFM